MNSKIDPEQVGEQLGLEGVGSMLVKIDAYCTQEVQRIELTNEPRIVALHAEAALLLKEEEALEKEARNAQPPVAVRNRTRRKVYAWGVVAFLTLAGFIFSVVALDPYRLGWKSYLYCSGIAVVTPFLIHAVLERFNSARFLKSIAAIAALAALGSLVLLAVIRGDVLAQEMSVVKAVVLLDGPSPTAPQHDFYGATLPLLRFVMALLAVAMELGAGLALEEAWRLGEDSEPNAGALQERLEAVRQRMLVLTEEVITLRNEPKVFAASFWRNVYRSMLSHTKSAMTKVLIVVVIGCIAFSEARAAGDPTTIVVAVDLSQSVQGAGPDGKTNFQKNIEAVSSLLGGLPASTHLVVLGITNQSFAQPYVLLSASVTDNPGHFGERLDAARVELAQLWKQRSAQLKPQSQYTDLLGALALSGQVFSESPAEGRHMLIIFSDMRHHTRTLDLESGNVAPSFAATKKLLSPAGLQNVEVYALGVDSAGKSQEYWEGLKAFWSEYFKSSGATLRSYSVFRELRGVSQNVITHR